MFVSFFFSDFFLAQTLTNLLVIRQEDTQKAGAYVCWCVQSLVTLEQGGGISLGGLESQLELLLEGVVTFNPLGELQPPRPPLDLDWRGVLDSLVSSAETGLEERHMALCGLFSSALALLNGVGVSTGEALAAHVNTWLDRKGRGFPILPLLTACSRCLASVRHMTRIMEACITAHFNHGERVNPSAFAGTDFHCFSVSSLRLPAAEGVYISTLCAPSPS